MQHHTHQALTLAVTAIVVIAAAACGSSGSSGSNGNGSGPVSGHSDTITGVGSAATTGGGGGGGGGNPYSTGPSAHARSASQPYFFTPTPDTVHVGSTVNFVFQDVGHTVTWDNNPGGLANISSLAAGGVTNADSTRVPMTAGTYTWHCSIHTYMTGTLVVQ